MNWEERAGRLFWRILPAQRHHWGMRSRLGTSHPFWLCNPAPADFLLSGLRDHMPITHPGCVTQGPQLSLRSVPRSPSLHLRQISSAGFPAPTPRLCQLCQIVSDYLLSSPSPFLPRNEAQIKYVTILKTFRLLLPVSVSHNPEEMPGGRGARREPAKENPGSIWS